jgi:glycosyltransferase involved in cell wall biosynthesis
MEQSFDRGECGDARIAVVIPARNEEATIADAVRRAKEFAHDVIVMDGHSTDRTAIRAREAGARVILDPGRGKGSALRASLDVVPAEVIVFMDADGSHDTADIPKLALPVARGEVDLCVGSRFTGGSDELSVNIGQLVRTVGNISMNIAINLRWGVELTDTLNGFRAVRRTAALAVGLREDRHTIEQEMVMKMLIHGYRVANVSTHEYSRQYGQSHINIWREWPRFVRCLIVNLFRRDHRSRVECSAGEASGPSQA